ncbi:MAG: DUF4160 domain-containing protein [Terriglobales bacterium]
MPTVLRVEGYRFFFFSNERQEPPHIHVAKAENYAKFWLDPVSLAWNRGFRRNEVTALQESVRENRDLLLRAWNEYFSN